MIRDYQAVQYTWFLRGKQHKIPTYGQHAGVKLIGVLNYETGHVFTTEEERYDAEAFLRFLHQVLDLYPMGNIVLVLDNARIHHAKLIQPFLQKHQSRLKLVFLPPYSPEMNMIEGLWKWLKSAVIYNVFHRSLDEIREHIQDFIASINETPEEVINRLCLRL